MCKMCLHPHTSCLKNLLYQFEYIFKILLLVSHNISLVLSTYPTESSTLPFPTSNNINSIKVREACHLHKMLCLCLVGYRTGTGLLLGRQFVLSCILCLYSFLCICVKGFIIYFSCNAHFTS